MTSRAGTALRSVGAATVGVALSGLMVNLYLILTARGLSPHQYLYFSSYWSIALILGFGAFLPLEQMLGREKLGGGSVRAVAGRALIAGIAVSAVEIVILLAAVELVLPALGRDHAAVVALLALCVVSAFQFVTRGVLVSRRRLNTYLVVLVIDSTLRAVLAGVLAASGVHRLSAYCWSLVVAIGVTHLVALVVAVKAGDESAEGDAERWTVSRIGAAVVPLLFASIAAQVLLNGLPVLVASTTSTSDAADAGRFQAAFQLVRLPLFAAVPLQTMILPMLVRAFDTESSVALGRLARRSGAAFLGLGALAVLVGGLAGPPVLQLLYGDRYHAARADFAVLSVAVICYLFLLIASQALVALGGDRRVALCWGSAVAAAVAGAFSSGDPLHAAEVAFLLGSFVGFVVSAIVLARLLQETRSARTRQRGRHGAGA